MTLKVLKELDVLMTPQVHVGTLNGVGATMPLGAPKEVVAPKVEAPSPLGALRS